MEPTATTACGDGAELWTILDDSGRNPAWEAGSRRLLQEPVTVRVLVADGYPVVRAGIRQFLRARDVAVVGEAATGAEAVAAAARLRPDVVVLDATLTDASRQIRAAVVVLSTAIAPELVAAAAEAGAAAYLVKDLEAADLLDAVRRVAAGERLVDPRAGAAVLQARAPLSSQELRVLRLAAKGFTTPSAGATDRGARAGPPRRRPRRGCRRRACASRSTGTP